MKKILVLLFAAGALAMASCNTKSCRCYELKNGRWTGPFTYSAYEGTPCGRLNTTTTFCNELEEPILDPDDIAVGKRR